MILNNPGEFTRITYPYTWWDNAFTAEELTKIIEYCESAGTEPSTTVHSDGQRPNTDIRRSQVRFHHPNEDTKWIFERFNRVIDTINNQFYGFDLTGYMMFQYGEYTGEDSGKYDWHTDMLFGAERGDDMFLTRKLSLTMLLNDDFEGGEFELNMSNESSPLQPETQPGRVILFPSFLIHRVRPVTSGTRRSIVIWAMGPKFR